MTIDSAAMTERLAGRRVLVTGMSRRKGIGFGIARELAAAGARLYVHHYSPHDEHQPWGAEPVSALIAELEATHPGSILGDVSVDLSQPGASRLLMDAAVSCCGQLDALVCNHARSGSDGSIFDVDEDVLDGHWATNARSVLMLTRFFAEQFAPADAASAMAPGQRLVREPQDELSTGRVIWLTSGQMDGPLPGEVAYGASKAALAGLTPTVCSELLSRNISLNTINPGPVNTGYMDPETADRPLEDLQAALQHVPFGRYGRPDDVGRLVAWLLSDEGRWVVGQVLTSDGGFRL
jgi:3-oxoacyl-[acyl-carrier protein] reductase